MNVNNLTGFIPQELAADQPNTFLQEQGIAFTQQTQTPVRCPKSVMGVSCPFSCVQNDVTPFTALDLQIKKPPQLLLQYEAMRPPKYFQTGDRSSESSMLEEGVEMPLASGLKISNLTMIHLFYKRPLVNILASL